MWALRALMSAWYIHVRFYYYELSGASILSPCLQCSSKMTRASLALWDILHFSTVFSMVDRLRNTAIIDCNRNNNQSDCNRNNNNQSDSNRNNNNQSDCKRNNNNQSVIETTTISLTVSVTGTTTISLTVTETTTIGLTLTETTTISLIVTETTTISLTASVTEITTSDNQQGLEDRDQRRGTCLHHLKWEGCSCGPGHIYSVLVFLSECPSQKIQL